MHGLTVRALGATGSRSATPMNLSTSHGYIALTCSECAFSRLVFTLGRALRTVREHECR